MGEIWVSGPVDREPGVDLLIEYMCFRNVKKIVA